jgi:endonuclease-3
LKFRLALVLFLFYRCRVNCETRAMQLMFELDTAPVLLEVRDALLKLFGPQRRESRPDPLSQLIHSLISARTQDEVGWKASARLHAAFPDWAGLADASPEKIETLIEAVTFADRKARQLPTLIRVIQIRTGGLDLDFLADQPVESAMDWLRSLPGVGAKTAAVTLNFSRLDRRALVVDTHVHRVAKRLGLVGRTSDAAEAHETLMSLVPRDWTASDLFELHWLIKGLGQKVCPDAAPSCGMCPLKVSCPRIGVGVGRKVVPLSEARRVGRS